MIASFDAHRARYARVLAAASVALAATLVANVGSAQAPAPDAAPKQAPKKAAPKKAAPKQPAPAQPQTAQPAPAAPQAPAAPAPQLTAAQVPPLVYSPWTKICQKLPAGSTDPLVCLTLREARLETGQLMAAAALIERAGDPNKLLRITMPLGMQLPPGTRLMLDTEQPVAGAYMVCTPGGCIADYNVNADFVGKLKKGQQIVLQGINMPGQVANFPMPLADFGKANDGTATDAEEFQKSQQKFWDEKLKKAAPPAAPPKQ